jgi:hypothetical protein
VKTFFRDNGLTIALVAMFLLSALGMIWSGHAAYSEELLEHGSAAIGLLAYLTSGDFLSALFENWESEFLQMSAYVMLTAMLFQRGSAESRDPDDPDRRNDEIPDGPPQAQPHSLVAVFLFAWHSAGPAVHYLLCLALVGEPGGRERGSAPARRRGSVSGKLSSRCTIVVRVLPELAVGIHVDGRPGRVFDFPAPQGLPGSKPTGASNSETGA